MYSTRERAIHNELYHPSEDGRQGPYTRKRGIDFAPELVRKHGLRETHTHPLVSHGKQADGTFRGSFRVPAQRAWKYASIELRSATAWPCMVFDIDGRETMLRAQDAWYFEKDVPAPNWTVQRRGGGGHAVYCLASPVHRGEQAREKPLRLFGRVAEWYSYRLDADPGFVGVLSHNPVYGGDLETEWGTTQPYDLRALAEAIPKAWREPDKPQSAIGRNVGLFQSLMKWAGSRHHLEAPVLPIAERLNRDFVFPLPFPEVAGIARSVERYRRRWIAEGRFYGEESVRDWHRRGQRASVQARRLNNTDRDAKIRVAHQLLGLGVRSTARILGEPRSTVSRVRGSNPSSRG